MKEFQPGVRSLHVRNDDYWREGANADEVEIFAITDKVARTSALLSGDIDLMQALDPKAVSQIEAAPGVGIWSVASGAYPGICIMSNSAPGNNPDFVLAMKYSRGKFFGWFTGIKACLIFSRIFIRFSKHSAVMARISWLLSLGCREDRLVNGT